MAEKGKILKTVIVLIFVVLLSGCSSKYMVNAEGEIIERKILSASSGLDVRIVKQDDEGVSLNLVIQDFVERQDIVEPKGFGKGSSSKKYVELESSASDRLVGCLGVGGGCTLGALGMVFAAGPPMIGASEPPEIPVWWTVGCITAAGIGALVAVASASVVSKGNKPLSWRKGEKRPDGDYTYVMCSGSNALVNESIEIIVAQSNYEKEYFTDEDGNIELKFDEVIPEPTEADSVLNLIIQYEEMADSVKVRRL